MQITHSDVVLHQEVGQILGHALGKRCDQHPLIHPDALVNLRQQIIHLGRRGPNLNLRVQQPGRSYHLLHHLASMLGLIIPRGGRNKDHLGRNSLPLLKPHGAVVQC